MGIPTYGIRICARMREDKYELSKVVHELLLINIIMCILTYFIFGLVLTFIPQIQKEKNLYIIISSTILFNAIGMEWLYKGLEQYKYITIRSIIFKLIALILMFALVHSKKDYLIYGTISVFAASASNIMNFIHVRKFIYFKPLGNYNIKKHIKPILIFLAMSCATNIYTNLDSVMLGFMKTETDVGYYDAAVKVKRILVSIVTSLGAVLLPRASLFIQKKDFLQFNKICTSLQLLKFPKTR
jgi:O-antigen/teichoic acid export membrane protein